MGGLEKRISSAKKLSWMTSAKTAFVDIKNKKSGLACLCENCCAELSWRRRWIMSRQIVHKSLCWFPCFRERMRAQEQRVWKTNFFSFGSPTLFLFLFCRAPHSFFLYSVFTLTRAHSDSTLASSRTLFAFRTLSQWTHPREKECQGVDWEGWGRKDPLAAALMLQTVFLVNRCGLVYEKTLRLIRPFVETEGRNSLGRVTPAEAIVPATADIFALKTFSLNFHLFQKHASFSHRFLTITLRLVPSKTHFENAFN